MYSPSFSAFASSLFILLSTGSISDSLACAIDTARFRCIAILSSRASMLA